MILPDESSDAVRLVFADDEERIAPAFMDVEMVNAIRNTLRRRRFPREMIVDLLKVASELPVTRIGTSPYASPDLLDLCVKHDLSVYDGLYLDLALRRRASLATFDRRLRAAAEGEGIAVLPEFVD